MHRCSEPDCPARGDWYGSVKRYLCSRHAISALAAEPAHQPRLLTTAEELPLGWLEVRP